MLPDEWRVLLKPLLRKLAGDIQVAAAVSHFTEWLDFILFSEGVSFSGLL